MVWAHSPHHCPYGATSRGEELRSWDGGRPRLLYAGTNMMLRSQPPFRPECTQCPAVATRLDLPGLRGSLTTVPEQTIGPFGVSMKTLPAGAAWRVYGVFTPRAFTGRGSGPEAAAPEAASTSAGTRLPLSSASSMRFRFQWSLM